MEINNVYKCNILGTPHLVYEGVCNNKNTKWITKQIWDYKIKIKLVDDELQYLDTNGNKILIYDEDDFEYKLLEDKKINN